MRRLITPLILVLLLCISVPASALGSYPSKTTGYDVSWPNCGVSPPSSAAFGIVGVNYGRVFTVNPCLQQEAGWFQNLSLYLSTSYPGKPLALKYASSPKACKTSDNNCLAYNYGYNAVRFAVANASIDNAHALTWWLDVENVNSWTDSATANTESLQGMIDALRHYTFLPTVGFYAYPGQWQTLTFGWRNKLPTWTATGSTSRRDALNICHQASFNGGAQLLTQYTIGLDRDYVC